MLFFIVLIEVQAIEDYIRILNLEPRRLNLNEFAETGDLVFPIRDEGERPAWRIRNYSNLAA